MVDNDRKGVGLITAAFGGRQVADPVLQIGGRAAGGRTSFMSMEGFFSGSSTAVRTGSSSSCEIGTAASAAAAMLHLDGLMVSSLAYAAPERLRGGRPSGPADVYAFGIVMFEVKFSAKS